MIKRITDHMYSMDRFAKQKRHAVNKLGMSMAVGDVDEGIVSLLKAINSLEGYYTTSSCAGRIQLFQDLGNKIRNKQIACWHRRVKYREVPKEFKPVKGVLYFKCEPPILHIAARTLEAAGKLLVAARESGFKRSGIQSVKPERFMVELVSTESIDAPIMEGGKKLVPETYIKYLVKAANRKYAAAQAKIRKLEANIRSLD